jgi:hypothetical protein
MLRNWRGPVGVALVVLGVAIVGLNIRPSLDPVILVLSENHGLHLTDLVGAIVVSVGVLLVWTREWTVAER